MGGVAVGGEGVAGWRGGGAVAVPGRFVTVDALGDGDGADAGGGAGGAVLAAGARASAGGAVADAGGAGGCDGGTAGGVLAAVAGAGVVAALSDGIGSALGFGSTAAHAATKRQHSAITVRDIGSQLTINPRDLPTPNGESQS